jgi:hypothetical protein
MAKRSRKNGRKIPSRTENVVPPARDYLASDNDITLVRPERDSSPAFVERWDQEPTTETVRALPSTPGGFFDFVQQQQGKPQTLTRPSPPPPEARAAYVPPPPPPLPEPRIAAAAPPPPPPPDPRPRAPRTTDIPPAYNATPLELQATLRPPVAPYQPPIRAVPSSLPPPVAIESHRETSRRQAQAASRPWLSMFTIGPLSALVAALVSSLLWSYHTRDLQAANLIPEGKIGGTEAAHLAPCTTRPGGANDAPASESTKVADGSLSTALQAPPGVTPQVSIDSLPTVGAGGVAKASVFGAVAAAEPAAQSVSRARSSRVRETRPVDLSSAQARPAESSDSSSSDSSSSDSSEAAPAPAPAARALPKGPDRGAVTKAMSRASRAASSCGTGPHDGRVSLQISPSGVVTSVSLVKGFGEADVNACVLRAFSRAKVPAYEGDPIQVRKAVRW